MNSKAIVKIIIGLAMLVTVFIGYISQPQYMIELTCISNTFGGLLLIADGVLNILKRKNIPSALYMNVCLCILTVFLVCMVSLTGIYKFNFKGAFFFLHGTNPIVFAICYMLFCKDYESRLSKAKLVLISPILMIMYLFFDYIQCQFTGNFVYGFVKAEKLPIHYALITGGIVYGLMCLSAYGLSSINRRIHRRTQASTNSSEQK